MAIESFNEARVQALLMDGGFTILYKAYPFIYSLNLSNLMMHIQLNFYC